MLVIIDATQNNEAREAEIGFAITGRILCEVHIEWEFGTSYKFRQKKGGIASLSFKLTHFYLKIVNTDCPS